MENIAAKVDSADIEVSAPRSRTLRRILFALLLALFLAGAAVAFWPAPADFRGDEATAGAGLGHGGLQRPFPAMIVPADNGLDNTSFNQRAELGRLLYFDPILSHGNDLSCATCHHPDLGFTDGRGQSMGKGGHGVGPERRDGEVLRRGSPTIWDAAYNFKQFWDGRAKDLEEQAIGPITSENEMGSSPDEVVRKLRAIPEYARLFDAAFGGSEGSGVTITSVVQAVASFERTLTANNSPFDRFVAGDPNALTAEQRRGFNLFRSGKTRCFECHGLPMFSNPDFKVIGVPDLDGHQPDLGRAEIAGGAGYERAFKVPTLRNVALTAPYMHNGRFNRLEEVLDFYAHGGGPGLGFQVPNLDDKIRPYDLSAQEREDLIAFLCSLTDDAKVQFPPSVPSGLPIVPRLSNPGRALAAKFNTGSHYNAEPGRVSQTIVVKAGESIQTAIDRATPGDTVQVEPGIYHEQVTIDLDNITLKGAVIQASSTPSPSMPVLDGERKLSDAVIATGNNFHIEGFEVRHYIGNGVAVHNAHGVVFRDLIVDDTGRYGVYPVSCTGVVIENLVVTRAADAGIYVGQSRDIKVRNSEAHDNVTGIEIENSLNAAVSSNYVHNNTGGILVFVLPNNPSKVGRNCKVTGNRVVDNNHDNFADPTAIVHNVPPGTGIMIMAADETEVTGNEIRGNDCYGVAVFSLEDVFPKGTVFDVGPMPEKNWVHANSFSNNGRHPSGALAAAGLPGADLIWDGTGWSNTWDEPEASRSSVLPGSRWPSFARRGWWRLFGFARTFL